MIPSKKLNQVCLKPENEEKRIDAYLILIYLHNNNDYIIIEHIYERHRRTHETRAHCSGHETRRLSSMVKEEESILVFPQSAIIVRCPFDLTMLWALRTCISSCISAAAGSWCAPAPSTRRVVAVAPRGWCRCPACWRSAPEPPGS